MQLPKLLTLLDYLPESPHGGAIIVRELASRYPADKISFFSCTTDMPRKPMVGVKRQVFRLARRPGRWGLYHIRDFLNWHLGCPLALRSLERFMHQSRFDAIWTILNAFTIPMARRLAEKFKLPLHVSVHDEPERMLMNNGCPRNWMPAIMNDFAWCYQNAASRDVISDLMRVEYFEKFKRDAIVIHHGIDIKLIPNCQYSNSDNPIKWIGFAGNISSQKCWETLLQAVEMVNSRKQIGEIAIRAIGCNTASVRTLRNVRIQHSNWLPLGETLIEIKKTIFNYLPIWFEPEFASQARLAFPTKLITYLAARRPMLVHAPDYSSSAQFINKYKAGLLCSSLAVEALAATIERLMTIRGEHEGMISECDRALREECDMELIYQRFIQRFDNGRY